MESKSVTFDTNVFSHIVRPENCNDSALQVVCLKLANLIQNNSIRPYVSETIFNLEGIERKDRPEYFGTYQPSMTTEEIPSENPDTVQQCVCIGPDLVGRPTSNPILVEKLEKARGLGFRLLSAPRIGFPRSPLLVEPDFGERSESQMGEQQSRFFEALSFISSLDAGIEVAKSIGNKFRTCERVWYEALKHASARQAKLAIGEWADGDSVAAHISYGIDFFCTRDEARDAGSKSVFASENRVKLIERFGIVFVHPDELLGLLVKVEQSR